MEHGDDDDRYAVKLLSQSGIQSILDNNRFGRQPKGTILDGHLDPTLQTANLNDCMWNDMGGTLRAK